MQLSSFLPPAPWSTTAFAIILHIKVLHEVTLWRGFQPPYNWTEKKIFPRRVSILRYEGPGTAILAAVLMFALPYYNGPTDPLVNAGVRVVCFFYACKSLDLGVARWRSPPTLMMTNPATGQREPAPLQTNKDVLRYILKLATEMRYLSFDIAAEQKGRPANSKRQQDFAWIVVPMAVLPLVTYLFPFAPLKCACLLFVIQMGLEGLHKLVHPRCSRALFWRPWAATTMSDFWTTHWHSGAEPFLRSLAYEPTKRLLTPVLGKQGGRAAAVLAAFGLSGVWHGWASAPAVTRPYLLAFQVWALFIAFGVACVAERAVWGQRQGSIMQRIAVWAYALCGAGLCARTLECYCRIDWVKRTQCPAEMPS